MIIHKLIAHHLKHGDDASFYQMQADDAIDWLCSEGVALGPHTEVLDLGCGHGVFGHSLQRRGCPITYADQVNELAPALAAASFVAIDLDHDHYNKLGEHDLVICSNVLEHLARPEDFLKKIRTTLRPSGHLYLSWTNWLSPWGGHDFSPFHYFGPHWGHRIFDRLIGRKRIHTPFETLYPTHIGQMIRLIATIPGLKVKKVVPRYYREVAFLMKIPVLREFIAWNCAMLIERIDLPEEA